MKSILIFFIAFILNTGFLFSQQSPKLSIEGDFDYFHSFHSSTILSDNLKYGYSLRFSDYIKKFKVSFGVSYSHHSFGFKNLDIGSVIKSTDYDVIRLYYPLIISYQILNKRVSLNTSLGSVVNSLFQCDRSVNYLNGNQSIAKDINVDEMIGISLYADFDVSLFLNAHLKLHLIPFAQFNLLQDHASGQLGYQEFLDEKPYGGLKFGVEYIIK